MPRRVRFVAFLLALAFASTHAVAAEADRVQLVFDTSEADRVLAIVAAHAGGKPIEESQWQALFATEPYKRLKSRQEAIAKRFGDPSIVLTDDGFKTFVLSDTLVEHASDLRNALERWKQTDLQAEAQNVLQYLPPTAVIHAKIYPVIKPGTNSFVWEPTTNPAIFLYLDPNVSAAKFTNTVAHELHHIGLASAQAEYDERIKSLPEKARAAAEWVGAFGEGLAMLAAAGGSDVDPHAASTKEEHARWERDLANFGSDLPEVNAFFLDILAGKFATDSALEEKGGSFFGTQGPWYTVGYRMAVIVERRYGRGALIQTMLDPRRLLLLYNQAVTEQNAASKEKLPLWSEEVIKRLDAK